jgi:hypothetical protein
MFLSDQAMVTLWTRMEEIYPHRWVSKLGEPGSSAFETWRQGLAGITPEQLRRGLQQCLQRRDGWPPTLPEFRGLCRGSPQSLELPTLEEAFRMASQQRPDWHRLHPIVFHARQAVGAYELIHQPTAHTWSRFRTVYEDLVEQALQGVPFTYPETMGPQLTQVKPSGPIKRRALKNLSAIRTLLETGMPAESAPAADQAQRDDKPTIENPSTGSHTEASNETG